MVRLWERGGGRLGGLGFGEGNADRALKECLERVEVGIGWKVDVLVVGLLLRPLRLRLLECRVYLRRLRRHLGWMDGVVVVGVQCRLGLYSLIDRVVVLVV